MEPRAPRNRFEHRAALARLIDRQGSDDALVDERIEMLEMYAHRRGLSLANCLLLTEGDRIEAVCLCLDSPGRTSTMLLSPGIAEPRLRGAVGMLMRESQRLAAQRGVQLLQGMVAPECADEALLYAGSGMRHLADLLYMQSEVGVLPPRPPALDIHWECYGESTHALFARVIEQTYERSLDCGSLNGVRHIEDILASHKATGNFDPELWRVGMIGADPVGAILLGYMEEQEANELVYMGCLPSCRNRGYGSALLAHGVDLTLSRGVTRMTLSVDEKNAPARKLYRGFGFHQTARRSVWIRILTSEGHP